MTKFQPFFHQISQQTSRECFVVFKHSPLVILYLKCVLVRFSCISHHPFLVSECAPTSGSPLFNSSNLFSVPSLKINGAGQVASLEYYFPFGARPICRGYVSFESFPLPILCQHILIWRTWGQPKMCQSWCCWWPLPVVPKTVKGPGLVQRGCCSHAVNGSTHLSMVTLCVRLNGTCLSLLKWILQPFDGSAFSQRCEHVCLCLVSMIGI